MPAPKKQPAGKAVAAKKKTDVAVPAINFAAEQGVGLEGADKESFAIPFFAVLQSNSPQVELETVEGAKAGLLINTVTEELFKEAKLVFVAFQRRYLRWGDRNHGGGFKGEYLPEEVDKMLEEGVAWQDEEDGMKIRTASADGSGPGDILKDTRQHYAMMVREDGSFSRCIVPMASTQIKRSKRLMAQMAEYQMTDPNTGAKFNPPTYARIYKVQTEAESNDKGRWHSFVLNPVGVVEDPDLYEACKAFHKQIHSGEAKADYASMEKAEAVDDGPVQQEADPNGKF